MTTKSPIIEMLERELGATVTSWHLVANGSPMRGNGVVSAEVQLVTNSLAHAKALQTHLKDSCSAWRLTEFACEMPDMMGGAMHIPIRQIVALTPGILTAELFVLLATENAQ